MPSAPSWKDVHADIRHRIQTSCGLRSCSTRPRGWATTRSPHAWTPRDRWCPSGANASTSSACPDLPINPREDDPPQFFPLTSSSRSKRWPANCPPQPAHRWPAGTARTWPEQPSSMHRAKVFGRCEQTTGIDTFDRLVDQVMTTQPYATARRVFWVVDNGSSHRGQASIDRRQHRWPKLRLIHLPVHASWLNQVEIYFSVVQRKVVSPNDFHTLDEVEARLLDFQQYYEQIATPFE